jgi:hypothetical protein
MITDEKGIIMQRFFKFVFLQLIILCLIFSVSRASNEQAGLEIDVLKAGVGARPLGMGGAFVAVADDVDSPYWNPAGLSRVKFYEITTMQTKLSTDANHYYVSYVQPLLGGAIGISWVQLSLGDIYETGSTTNEYNEVVPLGVFSYYSNAYMIAYGREIAPNLSFGLTAKYLEAEMPGLVSSEGGSAHGYSLTPGLLWKPSDRISVGMKIDELVSSQKWGTGTEEKVPAKYRLGIAYSSFLMNYPYILSGDYSQISKAGYAGEGALGVEIRPGVISLRAGLIDSAMTAGVGFADKHISIDYAYVNQLVLSRENVHRISLTGRW